MSALNETNEASPRKIKWLLVDIGDVLLLKNKNHNKTFTELLADELRVDIELAQKINEAHYSVMDIKYVSEGQFVADLEKNIGYKAPKDVFSYFARAYDKQVRANTELLDFLGEVRALGINTAVLSNTIAIYREIQERSGINKKNGFNPILYSWEVEMAKPNRDIFELALRELKAVPDEVLFIDDKLEHLNGARQVGMNTFLFEDTKGAILGIRNII